MAFFNPEAALKSASISSVILNGFFISEDLSAAVTSVTIQRDITQASTVKVVIDDYDRVYLNSRLANELSLLSVGGLWFVLVQVAKSGNHVTLTFEDALIFKLRQIRGPMTQAPGVVTRAEFAAQLCLTTLTPFLIDFLTPLAAEPLTRGTTQDPNEDTWTCLTRIAGAVGYRCFSDGYSIIFGPDGWLLNPLGPFSGPGMVISEFTGPVDWINFDHDIGKPVAKATVTTYADGWTADTGSSVSVTGLGAANGQWLVESISRDLNHTATTVALVSPNPTLPEPQPQASGGTTHQVSFTAHG